MTKYEIEHSHRARRGRQKQLEGESQSYFGGCLMKLGVILGIALVLILYFTDTFNFKTSLILGGVLAGILIIIGLIKWIGGEGTKAIGKDEEWIEKGGDRFKRGY